MSQWIPAWRYSQGIIKPRLVQPSLFTIHYAAINRFQDLVNYFKYNPDRRYADSTWCVGQYGNSCCMVDPNHTPWTNGTGLGSWTDHNGNMTTLINDIAFTVETTNDVNAGFFTFTDSHYQILAQLFQWTLDAYPYTHISRVCGHEHLVPNYKVDPGKYFDWEKFLVSYMNMKPDIYKSYMKFLQEAAEISGANWYTGITAEAAERKRQLCHEAALKIHNDLKQASSYYQKG